MSQKLNNKVVIATKWSGATEIATKLVSPISTMVLARLLTPDAFGILVTANMVISFAEIFTDAGFQKYIIQHEFKDDSDKYQSIAVAFWSNLFFSLILWFILCFFSDSIATLVGCKGEGIVIAVSSICIPIAAFSSIQMAIFKRAMDFKTLFGIRILGVFIPLLVTVPLAYLTKSYWSLIVGMISLNLSNAILLTWKSPWKPRWYYDFSRFKNMFSFTMWSMIESVSIWLTAYFDIFVVGTMLSQYYLGLYRTSMNTVAQIIGIITSATTPVLFSSLSRLQDNPLEFERMFFRFQKIVGVLVIPIGISIFLFKDFVTLFLLGNQWVEAAPFIGLWALISVILILLSHYSSEVYRAKGKPKLSVLSQWLYIIVLWPTVLIAVHYSFETLYVARSFVRLESILVDLIIMGWVIRINIIKMLTNIIPPLIAGGAMCIVLLLPNNDSVILNICYFIVSYIIYAGVILQFKEERQSLFELKKLIKR